MFTRLIITELTYPFLRVLLPRQGLTGNLAFAIAVAGIGSAFQHGYNIGVINNPEKFVRSFINETYTHRFERVPEESTVKLIYSIFVSITALGGMLGALCTGFVADKFGRRAGLFYNNIFVLIAAACMGFSRAARSYELLIFGRFIIGVNNGLAAGLGPMYLTEISPLNMRGAVGTIYQLVITISILISMILGMEEVMGIDALWPVLFALTLVPAVLMMATLPFCPESPKYTLLVEGKDVAAQRALTWLRGTIEVHDEMDEMRTEAEQMKLVPKATLKEMWHNPVLRQPLIIVVVVMLSQQLSGINVVMFFSTNIFKGVGLTEKGAEKATLIVGVVNVLMTVVSLVLVERAGRRTLHLIGLLGMAVTTIMLTLCMNFK